MICRIAFVPLIPLIAAAMMLGGTIVKVYEPGKVWIEEVRQDALKKLHHAQAP